MADFNQERIAELRAHVLREFKHKCASGRTTCTIALLYTACNVIEWQHQQMTIMGERLAYLANTFAERD